MGPCTANARRPTVDRADVVALPSVAVWCSMAPVRQFVARVRLHGWSHCIAGGAEEAWSCGVCVCGVGAMVGQSRTTPSTTAPLPPPPVMRVSIIRATTNKCQ